MKAAVSGAGLQRVASWLRHELLEPEHPLAVVEVRPRALGMVRLAREGGRLTLAAAASVDLPEGVLRLSMTESNVLDVGALRKALESLRERAGAPVETSVGLVLPDPVARISLVPLAELSGGKLEEMVRFRLRKVLPFDVREARIATLTNRGAGSALVAAVFRPVLEGYEGALTAVGLHPGLVEIAGLALTANGGRPAPAGDRLIVNWDEGYVSLVLTRGGWPLLLRTLAGDYVTRPEVVTREAANTVLYYRERLGGPGLQSALVRSAALPPEEAVALLSEPLGLVPEVLDPWEPIGVKHGGMAAQAVAGAASCVLRRVA